MARCMDCARFPWKPDADFSMLPPIHCAKELGPRQWTRETAMLEHNCLYYEGPKAVKENDADTGTESKAEEATGRKNSGKRK